MEKQKREYIYMDITREFISKIKLQIPLNK